MSEEVMHCFPINITDNGNSSQQNSNRLVSMVLRPKQKFKESRIYF